MPIFKKSIVIGLDIKADGVCLVVLAKNKRQMVIKNILKIEFPLPKSLDHWKMLSDHLQQSVEQLQIQGLYAGLVFPSYLTQIQQISLPQGLNEQQILAEINQQLSHHLPFTTERLYIDYVISCSKNAGYEEIDFIIAKEEALLAYANCIERTKLKLRLIDIDTHAIARFLAQSISIQETEINAILYICESQAYFIIFNNKHVLVSHCWQHHLTEVNVEAEINFSLNKIHPQNINHCIVCVDPYLYQKVVDELCKYVKKIVRFELSSFVLHENLGEDYLSFIPALSVAFRMLQNVGI